MPEEPFVFLESMEPDRVVACLAGYQPLVSALALTSISPVSSAKIMASMTGDRQKEVVGLYSKAREIDADVKRQISDKLKEACRNLPKTPGVKPQPQKWVPRSADTAELVNRVAEVPRRPSFQRQEQVRSRGNVQPSWNDANPPIKHDAVRNFLAGIEQQKKHGKAKPTPIDGKSIAAEILRHATPELRKLVANEEPGLYRELRRRMFVFEDLMSTSENDLARIFSAVDTQTAALALRFGDPRIADHLFRGLSQRKAEQIQQDIDSSAGERVQIQEIEDAQQKVLGVALEMQSAGQVVIDPSDPEII